jgi:hypothetical protein
MIDLKNRTKDTITCQFDRSVSAGSIRPQVIAVHRTQHNPRTGEKARVEKQVTVGGVLTIFPGQTAKSLPDVVLSHPVVKRLVNARRLSVVQHQPKKAAKKSAAASESSPAPAKKRSRR